MSTEETVWPLTFDEVKQSPPPGFTVSAIVQEPVILIGNDKMPFSASPAARIRKKGITSHIPVVRPGANYIADGRQIKPLPRDINDAFNATLKGKEPTGLTYSEVIGLMRSTTIEIPVVTDTPVFESANKAAEHTHIVEIPGLNATLYPYQEQGIAWMSQCIGITGGLILADQMGLGKSLQVIGLLLLHRPTKEIPALIVCPTTLIANWTREINRFAPGLTVMIHRGPNRAGIYKHLMATQVVITTYETIISDISIIRSVNWKFLIIDEAQAIKNPDAQRRAALTQIPRQFSIAVTGTPVENSLKDLWSLADFTIPGILGTEMEFDLRYPDNPQAASNLSDITAPFVLKRTVADVATDLPDRIDCDLPVELDGPLAMEYERIRSETLLKYPKAGALVATGQLQLFCAHPWLRANPGDKWEDDVTLAREACGPLLTPKMVVTTDLLRQSFLSGEKVLVFSIFNQIGELIREASSDMPPAFWGAVNGTIEPSRRQGIIDDFTHYDGPGVLILNPKVAGAGVNITAATVVIHYTQVWNPAVEAQASARAHRRGQLLPVTVFRLYYENTVEQVMLDRTLWKQNLADEAVLATPDGRSNAFRRALTISPTAVTQP